MKNKDEKLSFIKALIDQLDHQTRLPAKVYFNYYSANFDIDQQKEVLAELKKKKLVSSYCFYRLWLAENRQDTGNESGAQ